MIDQPQPHDLIRIEDMRFVEPEDASSAAAVASCLRHAPFVVVRRAPPKHGLVPVGIRGGHRGQRFAAWLDPQGFGAVVKPESLRIAGHSCALPALAALYECEQRLRSLAYPWGPTGSVGFELASGIGTVTESSDLDLSIRIVEQPAAHVLASIAEACRGLPCAVDLQIETPCGAFSLQEYRQRASRVLLRTPFGPVLVSDPWVPLDLSRIPA